MQDTGSLYLGAKYSYAEILGDEMVTFKYKSILRHPVDLIQDPLVLLHFFRVLRNIFLHGIHDHLPQHPLCLRGMFERAQHRDSRCLDPDEYLAPEEKDYLEHYLETLRALPQVSAGEREAITLSAMAGDGDARSRLTELYLPEVAVRIHRLPDPDLTLMQIGVDHIHLLSA